MYPEISQLISWLIAFIVVLMVTAIGSLIFTIVTYAPAVAVLMFQVHQQQTLINKLVEQVQTLAIRCLGACEDCPEHQPNP